MHTTFSFCKAVYHRHFFVGSPLPCWYSCTQAAMLFRAAAGGFLPPSAAGSHFWPSTCTTGKWAPCCKVWFWIQMQFSSAFTGDLILGLGLLLSDQRPAAKFVFQPKLPPGFGVWGCNSGLAPFLANLENSIRRKFKPRHLFHYSE